MRVRSTRSFRKLWGATTVSTLGDGIYAAALPLVAVTLTADPAAVAFVVASPFLAWALFGLVSGVLVDRLPRVPLMVAADVGRAAVVLVAAGLLAGGLLTVPLLVGLGFLLGIGQTVYDTGSQACIPGFAGSGAGALERANSRIAMAQTVNTGFFGPPLGALLFSVAATLTFLSNAASFVLSALLLAPLLVRRPPAEQAGPGLRAAGILPEILSGLRFLLRHRLLLTLTVTTALVNIALAAVESLLVVYAQQRLGLTAVGFGLLFAPLAIGGLLGAALAPAAARLAGAGRALVGVLLLLAVASALFTVATSVALVAVALVISGAGIAVYNVLGQSIRQAVTPPEVLGRVVAAFRMVAMGAVPLGAGLSGLAARIDLALPYAAGAVVMVGTAVAVAPVVARASTTTGTG